MSASSKSGQTAAVVFWGKELEHKSLKLNAVCWKHDLNHLCLKKASAPWGLSWPLTEVQVLIWLKTSRCFCLGGEKNAGARQKIEHTIIVFGCLSFLIMTIFYDLLTKTCCVDIRLYACGALIVVVSLKYSQETCSAAPTLLWKYIMESYCNYFYLKSIFGKADYSFRASVPKVLTLGS